MNELSISICRVCHCTECHDNILMIMPNYYWLTTVIYSQPNFRVFRLLAILGPIPLAHGCVPVDNQSWKLYLINPEYKTELRSSMLLLKMEKGVSFAQKKILGLSILFPPPRNHFKSSFIPVFFLKRNRSKLLFIRGYARGVNSQIDALSTIKGSFFRL